MPLSKFDLSRASILGLSLGGVAVQIIEKLGPVADLINTGACPWLPPLIVLAGATGGLGINRVAAALDNSKELRDATRDLLTNQDITLVQARAVEARLTKYAKQFSGDGMGLERDRLLELAKGASKWWAEVVSDPMRQDLNRFRDDQIAEEITPFLTGCSDAIIDAETWTNILQAADQKTEGEPKLSPEITAYFAGHLAGTFTHDLVEVLKTDFTTGGKAFAAVSLRFFGEILSSVRSAAQTQADLKSFLNQLPKLLETAQSAASDLRHAGLPSHLNATLVSTEARLTDALHTLGSEIDKRFDAVPRSVADELERRHLVRPTFGFKADVSRIIKYAPAELIGRETESKLLKSTWTKAQTGDPSHLHILTFVAFGGEGKTSLVADWVADLAHEGWQGCEAVFAWSFYRQGTREQTAPSSDLFLKEALTFFGDAAMAGSAQNAFDKGRRLSQLVGERRALLILDGLEPLQYAPNTPTPGELKDQGLAVLLKELAGTSRGLCVITTRYSIPDLRTFLGRTVQEKTLSRLSQASSVTLLKTLGVKGTSLEFKKLVEDVHGHALTLNLLGSYLYGAHAGDIRRRDRVKLEEADIEEQGGHAFRVMDAYTQAFEHDGKTEKDIIKGQRALALLSLLGLFDRPATANCLNALWQGEAIPGLTEPLIGLSEAQRNLSLTRLQDAKLLTVNRDEASGALIAIDAHPLLREYFAKRLHEQQPEAWRAAHRRLYQHLRTISYRPATLEELQPLLQAVFHGCAAGEYETTLADYTNRIQRRREYYLTNQLGAFGADLSALSGFFDERWTIVVSELPDEDALSLLRQAAYNLRAMMQLKDAAQVAQIAMDRSREIGDWLGASVAASTLSDLHLLMGNVGNAIEIGRQAVEISDLQEEDDRKLVSRAFHANALHQSGKRTDAMLIFQSAEEIQAIRRPSAPHLQSTIGFFYCELLLAEVERAAWRSVLWTSEAISREEMRSLTEACNAVIGRFAQTLESASIRGRGLSLADLAATQLAIARCKLYQLIADRQKTALFADLQSEITCQLGDAMLGFRQSGQRNLLPFCLLTRAWEQSLSGARTRPENIQNDLDEAWEIAERGPMPLFLADIHLHRARLFFRANHYPWNQHPDGAPRGSTDDLAAARRLIEKHGYWRRKQELEDAEAIILDRGERPVHFHD